MRQEDNIHTQPIKKTVAEQIIELSKTISGIASETANRTASKLSPIMSEPPQLGVGLAEENSSSYPPLFSELRDNLESIRGSLSIINNCLDRAEI